MVLARDEQIDVVLDLSVDEFAVLFERLGIPVANHQVHDLECDPLLEVHDHLVVLGLDLAVGLGKAHPELVTRVERQDALAEVELPQPDRVGQRRELEPQALAVALDELSGLTVAGSGVAQGAEREVAGTVLGLARARAAGAAWLLTGLTFLAGTALTGPRRGLRVGAVDGTALGIEVTGTDPARLNGLLEGIPETGVLGLVAVGTQPIEALETEVLKASLARLLLLVLEVGLTDTLVPGVDHQVEGQQGVVELELVPLGSQLDALRLDDPLEVARVERGERRLDALDPLAPTGLVHHLADGDRVVPVGFHDDDLTASAPCDAGCAIQFDRHHAGVRVLDAVLGKLLARVGHGVDVAVRQVVLLIVEHDTHLDPLLAHGRAELGTDQAVELVQVDEGDHLVPGDAVDGDHGAVGGLEIAVEVGAVRLGDPRHAAQAGVRDLHRLVLALDVLALERPLDGLTAIDGLGREREAGALVERSDQPAPEATQLRPLLDALTHAGERLLELLAGGTLAVVTDQDSALLEVDTDQDGGGLGIDAVLDRLDQGELERGVGVREGPEDLAAVEIDEAALPAVASSPARPGGHDYLPLIWLRARSLQSAFRWLESSKMPPSPMRSRR